MNSFRLYIIRHSRLCLAAAFFLLFSVIALFISSGAADAVSVGTVATQSGTLNVRNAPSTSASILGEIEKGDEVIIHEAVSDANGGSIPWYRITYGDGFGYVRSDYISGIHDEPDVPDESGEDGLPDEVWAVASVKNGTVTVRKGAGSSYKALGNLSDSDIVTAFPKESTDTWTKVRLNDGTEGYVKSTNIFLSKISADESYIDDDFEAYLSSSFPQSYAPKLRALHLLYPKWQFYPFDAGNWYDASYCENELGISLVEESAPSSWKSTADGAYDWTTGKWTYFDGKWVAASQEIVDYFLDPRNFLGPNTVFQFLQQSFDEKTQTIDGIRSIIADSFLADDSVNTLAYDPASNPNGLVPSGKKTYAETIYECSKEFGMNPYVLSAMIILEQGRAGTSGSISGTEPGYEGYYNFINVGAYTTSTMTATQRGLWFAKGSGSNSTTYSRPWNTRYRAIRGGVEYYVSGYLSKGQDTLYTKRFNVSADAQSRYEHQYMTNAGGAADEGYILSGAYSDAMRDVELMFSIPVYQYIPDTLLPMPTKDGSPNNKLSSISVTGQSLSPKFTYATQSYKVNVANEISEITIKAAPYDSTAAIMIGGVSGNSCNAALKVGKNVIDIIVTAQNGDAFTYTLTVTRAKPPIVTATVSGYTVGSDNVISGIGVSTMSATIRNSITVTGGATIKMSLAAGTPSDNNDVVVSTGDTVLILNPNGTEFARYTICVTGDIDGDGEATILDVINMRNHILNIKSISGIGMTAGDIDGDSSITILDVIRVRNHILGIRPLNDVNMEK